MVTREGMKRKVEVRPERMPKARRMARVSVLPSLASVYLSSFIPSPFAAFYPLLFLVLPISFSHPLPFPHPTTTKRTNERKQNLPLLQANTTIPTPKNTVPLKTKYLAPNRSDNGPTYIPNPKLTTKYSENTQAKVPSLMPATTCSLSSPDT
jgi:hypothetical protein